MSSYAPSAAAFEGVRLIRREPGSALVWTLMWFGAFLLSATVLAMGQPVTLNDHGGYHSFGETVGRFGPFAAVSILVYLLIWATTTVAVYRAVLRPHERRWFFLRLGPDEARVAIMTVSSLILVVVFGGAPAYLLLVLADPFMRALPDMARDIAAIGAVATVVVDVWLGVRLSLISVETFAEKRFHLTAYWPLARGRFWYLLASYFVCFLFVFVLWLAFFILGGVIWTLANPDLGAGGLLRRTSLLGVALALAALSAGFLMLSSTILCACQAYAFRTIVSDGRAGVVIS